MHTNMHVVFVSVECGMHTGYTYKYVYIRVLLLNPYAGYFNHAYECEGKRMAQAALIDMQVHVDRHTMDGYHACMPFIRMPIHLQPRILGIPHIVYPYVHTQAPSE